MLKEVFLIEEGLLLYHYSKMDSEAEGDSDQVILSSGLLSAIRDFSQHARSKVLESFTTEAEVFLFAGIDNTQRVLVGVFDSRAPRQVAQETMMRVRDLMRRVEMPEIDGVQLPQEEKHKISRAIDAIVVQLFGEQEIEAYMQHLLEDRNDIPLAFVVDLAQRKAVAAFARPKPLYREEQVREILLLHDTLVTTLSRVLSAQEYRQFLLTASGYAIAVCWSGNLLSVASGTIQTPESTVMQIAGSMCHMDPASAQEQHIWTGQFANRSLLSQDGVLLHESGARMPPVAGVFLSTLVNNLDSLVRLITRRRFQRFELIFGKDARGRLVMERTGDSGVTVEVGGIGGQTT
ncbi:MAG: hypothetical protein HXY34_02595 [Candidatus Thorarchaeota archaeon]|nr:hypothetical protein [Candidatus Thorarchaeota archaeon]